MAKESLSGPLEAFISYCREIQPQPVHDIHRFFEGVICFPYDKELLLQSYLFLNVQKVFPQCSELLLFEKPPYGEYTNIGKCDFVYLTHDQQVFLVETKFIDMDATGDTERKRRNKHRNKVINQVLSLKKTFCDYWQFESQQITCAVFTTDASIASRGDTANVLSAFISTFDLLDWQQQMRQKLSISQDCAP